MESLRIIHCLWNKQTLLFIANMFCNQKRSIISACVLIIEASKINYRGGVTPRVKGCKWMDTIQCFY